MPLHTNSQPSPPAAKRAPLPSSTNAAPSRPLVAGAASTEIRNSAPALATTDNNDAPTSLAARREPDKFERVLAGVSVGSGVLEQSVWCRGIDKSAPDEHDMDHVVFSRTNKRSRTGPSYENGKGFVGLIPDAEEHSWFRPKKPRLELDGEASKEASRSRRGETRSSGTRGESTALEETKDAKSSRVGAQFQALDLPTPKRGGFDADDGAIGEVLWDPGCANLARASGSDIDSLLLKDRPFQVQMLLMQALRDVHYDASKATSRFIKLVQSHLKGLPNGFLSPHFDLSAEKQAALVELFRKRKGKDFAAISRQTGFPLDIVLVQYYVWKGHKSQEYKTTKQLRKKRDADQYCKVCDDGGTLIICDRCQDAYHISCLSPPLGDVPEGNWYCDNCIVCSPAQVRTLHRVASPDRAQAKRTFFPPLEQPSQGTSSAATTAAESSQGTSSAATAAAESSQGASSATTAAAAESSQGTAGAASAAAAMATLPPSRKVASKASLYTATIPYAPAGLLVCVGFSKELGQTIFQYYRKDDDGQIGYAERNRVFRSRGDIVLGINGVKIEGLTWEQTTAALQNIMKDVAANKSEVKFHMKQRDGARPVRAAKPSSAPSVSGMSGSPSKQKGSSAPQHVREGISTSLPPAPPAVALPGNKPIAKPPPSVAGKAVPAGTVAARRGIVTAPPVVRPQQRQPTSDGLAGVVRRGGAQERSNLPARGTATDQGPVGTMTQAATRGALATTTQTTAPPQVAHIAPPALPDPKGSEQRQMPRFVQYMAEVPVTHEGLCLEVAERDGRPIFKGYRNFRNGKPSTVMRMNPLPFRRAGDEIVAIDDVPVEGRDYESVVDLLLDNGHKQFRKLRMRTSMVASDANRA